MEQKQTASGSDLSPVLASHIARGNLRAVRELSLKSLITMPAAYVPLAVMWWTGICDEHPQWLMYGWLTVSAANVVSAACVALLLFVARRVEAAEAR